MDWEDWDDAEKILTGYLGPHIKILKSYGKVSDNKKAMCYEDNSFLYEYNNQYNWADGTFLSSPLLNNNTASAALIDGYVSA